MMMVSINLLASPDWTDYALLDSGDGLRLERFGPAVLIRPEHQAVWEPALPQSEWNRAQAVFQPAGEESGGHWLHRRQFASAWQMRYKKLLFWARLGASRHLGLFPEQAAHWDWIAEQVDAARRPLNVLNLFGYTGLATLAAAQAGARVTHVDASKKTVAQGRENQALAGLGDAPIRWIVDDALKFVRREARRKAQYDGLILDPPKFGRGPQGEVWDFFKALPALLRDCRPLLAPKPVFVVLTAYAIRASALSVYYALEELMAGWGGTLDAGELVNVEQGRGRQISMAIYARWMAHSKDGKRSA